jgi:hypothetical protein
MQVEEFYDDRSNAEEPPRVIHLDCIFYHYLSREFRISPTFRRNFSKTQRSRRFKFILLPTRYDLIDYKW